MWVINRLLLYAPVVNFVSNTKIYLYCGKNLILKLIKFFQIAQLRKSNVKELWQTNRNPK